MAKILILSLSLTLLLLFHGSLAYSNKQKQQQQLRNECQIDNLDALKPSNRVEYEAGIVETWDPNHEQFQCAGVAVRREIIHPNGLVEPFFSNTPALVYIVQGEGVTSLAIPGCPQTFQSPQRGFEEGGKFQDEHQKIRRFRAGDVFVVPAGMAHWCFNDGNIPVIAVTFMDLTNSDNQLDTIPRMFYLAGNPQDEFQQQGQQQEQPSRRPRGQKERGQQSSCNNVLCGLDSQMLAQALNVDQSLIQKIQDDRGKRGGIVRVKGDLQVIKPPKSHRQTQIGGQEESEHESESQSERGRNGLEETICTLKLSDNVGDPNRADIYTPGVGRLFSLNSNNLPILGRVQLSFERGDLINEALLSPRWTVNAHSVVYAIRGSAYVQISDNNGNTVFDGEFSEGRVLVVPQNFVVAAKAKGEKFEWVAMKTNDDAMVATLSGKTSVLLAMPEDVLSNAFGISKQEARSLKYNNQFQTAFSRGRSSRMDMTADA